ncbi:unnamed protein product [Aureobasidium vineae]|uniref:Uncharacterized protein n=1 Tax=Aureobasidium vineae TaxID=2773715 RepID=A0A9N8JRE4_9PEZI|nr:unnamed protein product [Aureobasidium vineae]
MSRSTILAPYRPLELVSSGGFVSVMHLQNRISTHDLDFFPNERTYGRHHRAVREELLRLIAKVARNLRYRSDWANDEVKFFLTLLNDPEALFNESKRQMRAVYQNEYLAIYAVKWEWVLARKLKRLQRPGRYQKPQDWLDCVSITTLLLDRDRVQLSPSLLRRYDHTNVETPVRPKIVVELSSRVRQRTNRDPFPGSVWVYTRRGFHYQWTTGESIPHNLWPPRRGRVSVYIAHQRQWRIFDFRRQIWL